MKIVFVLIMLIALSIPANAEEFRGIWADAYSKGFKTQEEVTEMINLVRAANLNAIIVQVRKRGDAYYNSNFEPKASDIDPDFDPLAEIIKQGREAGLEVHAWLSVYEVSHETHINASNHIAKKNPEWLSRTRDGKTIIDKGRIFADPGIPEVREHICNIALDIINNYDVDGIHLDNPRYFNRSIGYNPASVARFNNEAQRDGAPNESDGAWAEWRAEQVTQLIREVNEIISMTKPDIKFSVAVATFDPNQGKRAFMQDWKRWIDEEIVDIVIPMIYAPFDEMAHFTNIVLNYQSNRHIYIGIGSYQLSADLAIKQINDAREAGAKGIVLYNYLYLGYSAEKVRFHELTPAVFADKVQVSELAWKKEEN